MPVPQRPGGPPPPAGPRGGASRRERRGRGATIVIDRPEARNAVDGPAARALVEAFTAFARDDGLGGAARWGAGGGCRAGARSAGGRRVAPARALISRRAAPSAGCAFSPTATGRWARAAWRSASPR